MKKDVEDFLNENLDEHLVEFFHDIDGRLKKLEASSAPRWPTSFQDFTKTQRRIILSGVSCLVLLATIVPWDYTLSRASAPTARRSAGYRPIVWPPEPDQYHNGVAVAWPRLLIPMAIVTCVAGVAVALTKPKAKAEP